MNANKINFKVQYYGGFKPELYNSITNTTELYKSPKLSEFKDVLFLRKDQFKIKEVIVVKKFDDDFSNSDWFIYGANNNGSGYYGIPDKYKTHIIEMINQYDPKKCHRSMYRIPYGNVITDEVYMTLEGFNYEQIMNNF